MPNRIVRGAIAGAAGTVALDAATYADMALRGRSSSDTPASLVGVLADRLGITPLGTEAKDDAASNRRSGLGVLLGYATGVGVGIVYGALRGRRRDGSVLAGAVVGLAAMTASDVPIALSGVSDPRAWGLSGWASDAIPHLVYGLVTVATYEAVADPS